MSRYLVETVSLSPGKELKAGNGFTWIELHELRAVGLSRNASSTLTFSRVLGKAAFYTCLLQLNLTLVPISHGSSSLLGATTAESCWVYGKDPVPEALPCWFWPEMPKESMWHSASDSKAEYPDSIQATLQLLQVSNAQTPTWHLPCPRRPGAFGPSWVPAKQPTTSTQSTTASGLWKGRVWNTFQNHRSLPFASSKSLLPRCFPTMNHRIES